MNTLPEIREIPPCAPRKKFPILILFSGKDKWIITIRYPGRSWLWDSAIILRGSIDSSIFNGLHFRAAWAAVAKADQWCFEEEGEAIMERKGISREDTKNETYFRIFQEACWQAFIDTATVFDLPRYIKKAPQN